MLGEVFGTFINALSTYRSAVEGGTAKDHHKHIARGLPYTISNADTSVLDNDVNRSFSFVPEDGEREAYRLLLKDILTPVVNQSQYWQGMSEFCSYVVYACHKGNKDKEETAEFCYLLLEKFIIPLMHNNALLYKKAYEKTAGTKEYKPPVGGDSSAYSLLDLKHILLWFSRDLSLADTYKAYVYFINNRVEVPFLFLLASIEEVRRGDKINVERAVRKTEELKKKYRTLFKEFNVSAATKLFLVGAASFGLLAIILAVGYKQLHKSNN